MEDTDTQVTHRDKESSVGVSVMSISDNSVAMKNLVSLKEKINGTISVGRLWVVSSHARMDEEKKKERINAISFYSRVSLSVRLRIIEALKTISKCRTDL